MRRPWSSAAAARMLVAEEAAGSSDAGLDLVDDE